MNFSVRQLTIEDVQEMIDWRYPPPYDLYNLEAAEETYSELLDGSYYGVMRENELFGFYCTGLGAQVPAGRDAGVYSKGSVDIGLGIRPARTGSGHGTVFLNFILREIQFAHPGAPLRLTVAAFNARAIRLYSTAGFVQTGNFAAGPRAFYVMEKSTSADCT